MREPEPQVVWDVEWVNADGVVIGTWRRLDREIAEHVARRWLAARPQSQVSFSRRVRVQGEETDKEIVERVQILRRD